MKQYLLKAWMTAALSLLVLGGVWGQVDYVSNFPVVSEIGESQVTLEVQVDQSVVDLGSHYVILESSEDSPSLLEVLYRTNQTTGEQYPISGRINLDSTLDVVTKEISGLAAGTSYSVYYYTRSFDGSVVIEQASPTKFDFVTLTPPEPVAYSTNYPSVSGIGEDGVTLEVQVDQSVAALGSHYVILESSEASPSLLEVLYRTNQTTGEQYPISGRINLDSTLDVVTKEISGLAAGTSYSVYYYTRSFDGSVVIEQASPTKFDFVTLTPPEPVAYSTNYPSVSGIGEDGVTLEVQVDQSVAALGSHYVILESSEASPSLLEVLYRTNQTTGEQYPISGRINLDSTLDVVTKEISGLAAGTSYSVYYYTRSFDGSVVIEQASPTKFDFVTLTPPEPVAYSTNYPSVSGIGEDGVTLEVQVDQSVAALGSHYVILESSEASPSLLEVLYRTNQTTGEQYPISGRINLQSTLDVVTEEISGLAAGTSYSVYYYTRSFDGSVVIEQASPTKFDFVTLTPPEPVAYSTNYPSVSGIGEDGVTLEVQVDQSVVGLGSYYVILESSEASPSLSEVFEGMNHTTWEQYPISGRINLHSTLDVVTKEISGLAAGTSYSVYYYTRLSDGSVNIEQASPTKIDFVTLSEAIPPAFVLGTMLPAPGISDVSRSPIIKVQFDRPIQWGVEGLFRIREVTGGGIETTVSPGEAGASISSDLLSIEFTSPRLA